MGDNCLSVEVNTDPSCFSNNSHVPCSIEKGLWIWLGQLLNNWYFFEGRPPQWYSSSIDTRVLYLESWWPAFQSFSPKPWTRVIESLVYHANKFRRSSGQLSFRSASGWYVLWACEYLPESVCKQERDEKLLKVNWMQLIANLPRSWVQHARLGLASDHPEL